MKIVRTVSVILCFLIAFLLLSCAENEKAGLNFIDEKCREGRVSIEINTEKNDNCRVYFANINGEKLSDYSCVMEYSIGDNPVKENIVLPEKAKSFLVVWGNYGEIIGIPDEYLVDDNKNITFGALSDVHYNRYSTSGSDDGALYFDRALDYFDTLDIDLVGIAGDITSNGERRSLVSYADAIKERKYPVFTVSGNHDVIAVGTGIWQKLIKQEMQGCIYAENNLDFIYDNDQNQEGVFVFLNQVRWEYNGESSTILNQDQLIWLENTLEEYKNETVYLFFHTFLCGDDGEKHTGVGNIKNSGGYTYDLPYTYGADDEVVFRELLKKYKNVIFFSGHSHWMFEMECYNEKANYSNFDGEYCHMVHVPSVTEPRYIGENDTNRTSKNGEYSQGWIVEDYDGYVILIPVDFINQTYYTEYMEIIYK